MKKIEKNCSGVIYRWVFIENEKVDDLDVDKLKTVHVN